MTVLAPPDLNTYVYLALALVTLVLSSGRITRLVVEDEYPPTIALRMRWDEVTHDGPWAKLVHCPWCFGPWVSAVLAAWAYVSNLHWTWWVVNAFFALGYVTSWVVFHDSDGAE